MPLTLQQLKALDALVRTGLDVSESARRAWFDALPVGDDGVKALLEKALFPERGVESGTFLAAPSGLIFDGRDAVDDAEDAERSDAAVGQQIGTYTLDALLGEGGSASVWRAHRSDGGLKRSVALKLPYFVGNTRGWHDRVLMERDILASLQHPNIANIFDAGVEANGRPWLALEVIDGERIDTHCARTKASLDARVTLVRQVARTVEYAHARGVIHRDLKPANILVDQQSQVKLLDFGIAKLLSADAPTNGEGALTQLHGRPFTPDYASPEQRAGAVITTGTDVYALGVILYELLTGLRPLTNGSNSTSDVRAIAPSRAAARDSTAGVSESIRPDLDAVCLKALHPDPQQRYATASAFADDLDRYTRNEPVSAQPDSQRYRITQFVRRNKLAVSAAGAVALSLIGGVGVASWQAREANLQRGIAETQAASALAATDDAQREKRAAQESFQRAEASAAVAQRASEESAQARSLAEAEAARARAAESARLVEALAARREAQTAKATKDFLVKLFETNSLDQAAAARKRALPVEALLKEAVAELPKQFAAQPALRAELLGVVGGLLRDLHLNRDAIAALNIRVSALKSLTPQPDVEIFATRYAIAAALYDTGETADAKSQLLALDKELQSNRDPKLQRIRANVNGTLSHLHSSAYERSLALAHGQRAVELSDTYSADVDSKIDNLQHYAYALDVNEQIEASRTAYRRAIELAESEKGRDSIKVAQTQLTFGESLVAQNAPRLAIRHLRRAIEVGVPKWGEDSFWASRAYEALGRSLSNVGEFEEAQAMYAKSQIGIDNNIAHIPVDTVIRNRLRYVDHLLNYGDPATATSILERLPAMPTDSGVGRVLLPLTKGRALTETGAYEASLQHFQRFSQALASLWPLESAEHAHILLRIALNQSLLAKHADADSVYDGVLKRFPDLTGPLGKVQHIALAQKALNAYLAGDAAAALKLSTPIVELAIAQPVDQRRPNNTHIMLLRHAIYLKALGRCAEALPLLTTTSAIASKFSANSLLRAQSIAVHRECFVSVGDTKSLAGLPTSLPVDALARSGVPLHNRIGVDAIGRPVR